MHKIMIHTYTCIHANIPACMHAYMHTCMHPSIHTHTHTYIYRCLYAHTHIGFRSPNPSSSHDLHKLQFRITPPGAQHENSVRQPDNGSRFRARWSDWQMLLECHEKDDTDILYYGCNTNNTDHGSSENSRYETLDQPGM